MELRELDITERNFLLLAESIDKEFGQEVPWLSGLGEWRFSMNPDYFRQRFIDCVRGKTDPDNIVAYCLTSTDISQTYLGGMLHLPISPEEFASPELSRIKDQLAGDRYSYVTCLHVRDVKPGKAHGLELFSKAMSQILSRYPKVWGVVSKEKLLPWYEHFGAKTITHMSENMDELALVTIDENTFRPKNY